MACYDPDTEEYQSVCRVMSGFSDAFCIEKWLNLLILKIVISRQSVRILG
ncbi:putative DNA ligase (ATP) [Helianthus anomalus]